jgi:hypothetical protein
MKKTFLLLAVFLVTLFTSQAQTPSDSARATDSLKQVVHFLENLLQSVEKSKNDAEKQVAIMGRYIKDAQKMETTLGNNFSMLHPKNETFKTELTRQFHFIMQSVALYRSDLRSTNLTSTENTNRELKYLTDQIPKLMEKRFRALRRWRFLAPDFIRNTKLQIYEKLSYEALHRHFCKTRVTSWRSVCRVSQVP